MLERFLIHPHALRRVLMGVTGPHMAEFATALASAGYTRSTGQKHIRSAAHLGRWMEASGRALADLDDSTLTAFFSHFSTCQCGRPNEGKFDSGYAGARSFLSWAQRTGLARPAKTTQLPAIIVEFEAWMTHHRNVAASTLRVAYRLMLRRFVEAVGEDPAIYDAGKIRKFILDQGQRTGRQRTKGAVTAVRSLLRFLAITGRCSPDLIHAPPSIAGWRLAPLPTFVSPEEVEKVITACDPETRFGLRNRAMVLLMARLGLRAGDVTALTLTDVDWQAGTVLVSGKGRRGVRMPLPQDVGDAILAWLDRGRPDCMDHEVFVRIKAPIRPLNGSAAAAMVAAAIRRAGVKVPRVGSHVLRHSAASALLNGGMSLPAIGALLRHKSLDTTTLYAKVDVATLSTVARPWVGEVTS